jgi:aconitate decarboxylase
VQGRLRLAATGMADGVGFHKPGTTGLFGAVTAAIKMLELDREQALMAYGIGGSRAGSLSINTGSMTKSSHSGHSARMGIECGLLAQKGWTASSDVFGKGGFFDTFLQGNAKPELLVQDFGAPFRMVEPGVGFKKHPSNYFTHRPIDAALALRARHRLDPGAIARVDIRFPRFDYVNRPQPKTGLDGKFSVQYTTVVALLDGEITVDSFDDARRFAPDAVGLLERTTLHFDDAIARDFDRMHCIVAVTLQDGRVLEEKVEKLSGWVGFPLSAEQRLRKFHGCARRVLDADAAARVVELVERLDSLEDVRGLMDIVRGNG